MMQRVNSGQRGWIAGGQREMEGMMEGQKGWREWSTKGLEGETGSKGENFNPFTPRSDQP